jgi:hypothetical protein
VLVDLDLLRGSLSDKMLIDLSYSVVSFAVDGIIGLLMALLWGSLLMGI